MEAKVTLEGFEPQCQNKCEHKQVETMINIFKGLSIEMCVDCLKELNVRELTDEEMEDFYADDYDNNEEED